MSPTGRRSRCSAPTAPASPRWSTRSLGTLELVRGTITIDGARVDRQPPERRPIGVCFQDDLLFPRLSALENVAFPLRARRVAKADARRRGARTARAHRSCRRCRRATELPLGRRAAAGRARPRPRVTAQVAGARRAVRERRRVGSPGPASSDPRDRAFVRRRDGAHRARPARRAHVGRQGRAARRRHDHPDRHARRDPGTRRRRATPPTWSA